MSPLPPFGGWGSEEGTAFIRLIKRKINVADMEKIERRMQDLTPEARFLLTRLALIYIRSENDASDEDDPTRRNTKDRIAENRFDALMDAAERLGLEDLGSQLLAWAQKQIGY